MGGWTGHRLAWAGCSVSPVARGATLAALQSHRLQSHGLQLHQGGQRTSQAVAPSANPAVVSEQIQTDIWFKLWGNVTVNLTSTLTGATTGLIMNDALVAAARLQTQVKGLY